VHRRATQTAVAPREVLDSGHLHQHAIILNTVSAFCKPRGAILGVWNPLERAVRLRVPRASSSSSDTRPAPSRASSAPAWAISRIFWGSCPVFR
jgi:hypothetical protein